MTASSSMLTETQLKCSSLPPGLAGPGSSSNRLNRSKSNAGSQSQDPLAEDDEAHEEKKKEDSFFGRFFGRQSGKKKKSKEETNIKIVNSSQTFTSKSETISVTTSNKPIEDRRPYSVDPFMIRTGGLIKTGPSSRQRVQPIDIPISPELARHQQRSPDLQTLPPKSPEKPFAAASSVPAFHTKLEQHIRQRTAASTSPPKQQEPLNFITSLPPTIPSAHSVSPPKSLWTAESAAKTTSIGSTRYFEARMDDARNKMKIAGLSSLQQRVLSHNDHDEPDDTGFKSLTDFPLEPELKKANVTKSHSFKSVIKSTTHDSINPCLMVQAPSASASTHSSSEEANLDSLSSVGASKDTESFETTIKPEVAENVSSAMSISLDSIEDAPVESNKTTIDCKRSASNESVYSNHSAKHFKSDKPAAAEQVSPSEITINCGPPPVVTTPPHHTSIVNIGAQETVRVSEKTCPDKTQPKEQAMTTKIQVKREAILIPEFFNVQLNKVDHKPSTTVVLSTSCASLTSPVIVEEKTKLKQDQKVVEQKMNSPEDLVKRKFSAENMEIIDKETTEEVFEVPSKSPSTNRMFKKHSETVNQFNVHQRKSSLVSISSSNPESPTSPTKPFLKKKSNSLEVVDAIKKMIPPDSPDSEKSFRIGLDKSESMGNVKERRPSPSPDIIAEAPVEVVLRRKSLAKQRQDEEPELMKVFARRSLKLKDCDVEALNQQVLDAAAKADADAADVEDNQNSNRSRDSDKENDVMESPPEERKRSVGVKETPKIKEPLVETKELPDVVLRKSIGNNKFNAFSRAVSLNTTKTNNDSIEKFHKQNSLNERPKTEMPTNNEKILNKTWISNAMKQKEAEIIEAEKIPLKDDLSDMVQKSDFINEDFTVKTKNFNQRKAEWEQRAQQALKKNTP